VFALAAERLAFGEARFKFTTAFPNVARNHPPPYGTYDMTNYATLKDWPLPLTVVDIVWGGFITSLAAVVGYYASRSFGGVA
jgi:uncharacterized membrane protein